MNVKQSISHVALVVRDYDEAIAFFTQKLGFTLVEDIDQPEQNKRWVTVVPPGSTGTALLLARPSHQGQEPYIGNQTGGRVTFFLRTDSFWRDYRRMKEVGIEFVREPAEAIYGTVAVFKDLYGNLWDLVGPGPGPSVMQPAASRCYASGDPGATPSDSPPLCDQDSSSWRPQPLRRYASRDAGATRASSSMLRAHVPAGVLLGLRGEPVETAAAYVFNPASEAPPALRRRWAGCITMR